MRSSLLALLLAIPAAASADVDRCATADVDVAYAGNDIAEVSGDTGWFPSGYVAQLRLSGKVAGHTLVESGLRTQACWKDGKMEATLAGRAGAGWLDVAYGAEVSLKGRIHTSVLGKSIDWEGNIPLPYIPMDLLLEGQTAFDPAIDPTKIARVSDGTSPITLLSTDIIGDYLPISGISGGLRVSVSAQMASSFRTKKATVAGGTIDSPTDKVPLESTGPRGFSGGLEVAIQTEGTVRYEPTLRFAAGLQVTILGIRVVDWELFAIPMGLPAFERTIKLTGEATRLALPVLEGIGEGARMDFASGTVQELPVRNLGEGTLSIEPTVVGGALVSAVTIPPGGSDVVKVFVSDDAAFSAGAFEIKLATNDPDRDEITIQLGKQVGGTDPGVPPDESGESGGCSAGGSSTWTFGLILLGLLVRRRRNLA